MGFGGVIWWHLCGFPRANQVLITLGSWDESPFPCATESACRISHQEWFSKLGGSLSSQLRSQNTLLVNIFTPLVPTWQSTHPSLLLVSPTWGLMIPCAYCLTIEEFTPSMIWLTFLSQRLTKWSSTFPGGNQGQWMSKKMRILYLLQCFPTLQFVSSKLFALRQTTVSFAVTPQTTPTFLISVHHALPQWFVGVGGDWLSQEGSGQDQWSTKAGIDADSLA